MKRSIALAVFVLAASASFVCAEDTVSFVVAPPPVGYPELAAGSSSDQVGLDLTYLSLSLGSADMSIYGLAGYRTFQTCPSDTTALNFSFGASLLAGDQYDLAFLQLPLALNAVVQVAKLSSSSVFLFGGAGLNLGYSTMTLDAASYSTTSETLLLMENFSGGLQANLEGSGLVFSPYGRYLYQWGSYSMSYTSSYGSDSMDGDIAGQGSWIFGLDILDKRTGMSLSSMLRSSSEFTMFTLSFRWLLGPAPKSAPAPDAEAK